MRKLAVKFAGIAVQYMRDPRSPTNYHIDFVSDRFATIESSHNCCTSIMYRWINFLAEKAGVWFLWKLDKNQ